MLKFSKILEQQERKLNILYIHGLGGNSTESDVLKADNINIISKNIDYDNVDILNELLKENIEGVIGHSLGGLLAYYISNIKKIPSLLFNPAFEDPDIKFELPNIKKFNKNQIAIVGLQDDDILAETQIKNLKKPDCKIYIENIGHDISDDIKLIYFDIFLENFNITNEAFNYITNPFLIKFIKQFDTPITTYITRYLIDNGVTNETEFLALIKGDNTISQSLKVSIQNTFRDSERGVANMKKIKNIFK